MKEVGTIEHGLSNTRLDFPQLKQRSRNASILQTPLSRTWRLQRSHSAGCSRSEVWKKTCPRYVPSAKPDLSNGVANAVTALNDNRIKECQEHLEDTYDEEMSCFEYDKRPSLKLASHDTMAKGSVEGRKLSTKSF
uniref:Uncharacterized protein n=1 Tax=Kwoniella bestiolae CBS 10118 TaxID=1296100 RepID=A0A1B9G6L2_9TREE|nr:hypothetical protein I302_04318 [Kwoniella bestiolae CBS 10118]OCF26632.1 hypothetical protein I302_04318 [Kwoniella bestiolae CBS 10118]